MARYEFTAQAERDLDNITDYTVAAWRTARQKNQPPLQVNLEARQRQNVRPAHACFGGNQAKVALISGLSISR